MTARVHQQQRRQQQQGYVTSLPIPDAASRDSPPEEPTLHEVVSPVEGSPVVTAYNPLILNGLSTSENDRLALSWQEVRFLDGQPHIWATLRLRSYIGGGSEISGGSNFLSEGPPTASPLSPSTSHSGWFRLALGVGGTGVVLSGAAASELGFLELSTPLAPTGVMAGPGEGRARLAALMVSY